MSTLSVETSSSGSSTSTESPTCLSQRVIVPSVTDSPSAGISTSVPPDEPPEEEPPEEDPPDDDAAAGSGSEGCDDSWGASSCWGSSCCGASCCWELSCAADPPDPSSPPVPSDSSPMTARSPPISTVSSSSATIRWRIPACGAGISVSTLSVETSSSGSSTSTWSPTCFSHRVMVPSVTLSPRAGIWTV